MYSAVQLHINQLKLDNWKLHQQLLAATTKAVSLQLELRSIHQIKKAKNNKRNDRRKRKLEETTEQIIEYSQNKKRKILFENAFKSLTSISDIVKLENHEALAVLKTNPLMFKFVNAIPALKKLNNLVGLSAIKTKVFKLICKCIINPNNVETMQNIILAGPPGVGKTETAKALAEIMASIGILQNKKVIIAKRSDFVGKYLGETAIKTQELIDKAIGGVLFIDEVYALGSADNRDSFAKEAVDTLNQALSENKGKLLCIIAGYEAEIESCFFAQNMGLKRRFPIKFDMTGQSPEELSEIFQQKVEKTGWKIQDPVALLKMFQDNGKYLTAFAGDTEILLEHSLMEASERVVQNYVLANEPKTILVQDVNIAMNQLVEKRIPVENPSLDALYC